MVSGAVGCRKVDDDEDFPVAARAQGEGSAEGLDDAAAGDELERGFDDREFGRGVAPGLGARGLETQQDARAGLGLRAARVVVRLQAGN